MKKILFALFTTILFTVCAVSLFGASRLVDDANLLTASDKSSISSILDQISEQQQCDVIIVTVKSISDNYNISGDADAYAEDYFSENDYGYGDTKDGILLLISIADNDWAIHSNGFAGIAFTSAGKEHIMGEVTPLLAENNFNEAFTTFAKKSDTFLTQAKKGKPYGEGNLPGKGITYVTVLISLGIGIILALIITTQMKSALKTVHQQTKADEYVHEGSMNITVKRETFLYKDISKTERQTSTNSSSGGGSNGSSSGKF